MRLLLPIAMILLAASAVRGEDLPKLRPGANALYAGTVKIQQSSGEVGTESTYKATVACRVRDEAPGKSRLFAVRILKPSEGEEEPLIAFEDAAIAPTESGMVITPDELAGDLQANRMRIALFFPLELLPELSAPVSGTDGKSESEVSVIGLGKVKAPFTTTLKKDGDRIEITRKLAPGSQPPFDFHGDKARLLAWSETYVFDSDYGLPLRIERTAAMESEAGQAKLRFERSVLLEAKRPETGSSEAAAKLDAIEKELRGLCADFAAARSPDDIAKRTASFGVMAKGSIFEVATETFALRLAAYRATGMGKTAPDFTLESLDGKQVSFREATKGKVVLLSFWAVG